MAKCMKSPFRYHIIRVRNSAANALFRSGWTFVPKSEYKAYQASKPVGVADEFSVEGLPVQTTKDGT